MRHRIHRLLAAALLCTVVAACASTGSDSPRSRTSPNLITVEEIAAQRSSNAYELVQSLRPGWLRTRGTVSITQSTGIAVYLDNIQLGGIDSLRSISMSGIHSLRFIDAGSATQRWGTGHPHGAIQLISASGR